MWGNMLIGTIGCKMFFEKQKKYRTYRMRGAYQLMCFYPTMYVYNV